MNAPMNDYLLLMHEDAADAGIANDGARWGAYLASLRASGGFDGGSSIGPGAVLDWKSPCLLTAWYVIDGTLSRMPRSGSTC